MRILALGAHHDDVELGCGGSLLAWRTEGHEVTIFTATRSGYRDEYGQEVRSDAVARAEGEAAAALVGARLVTADFPTFGLEFAEPLNARIMQVLDEVQPDLVLTHWADDVHHDHRALALSTLHCARRVGRLLTYASNWLDGRSTFAPRFFVDISRTLEAKCRLVEAYRSENERTGGRWLRFVRAQASLLGLKAGVDAAEGFEVIRWAA